MASIQKRANGRWRARFRDEGGREHARHFERKFDAQAWLDEETAKIVRGDWADPRAGRESLRAYATRWQSIQVSSAGTARIVDNALRVHTLPRLGQHRIGNIRRSDVQAFVKWLESGEARRANGGEPARPLSPGSIRNVYEVLARVMDAAVEDRVISISPCRRITLPKDHNDEVEVATLEDIEKVRSGLGQRWQAIPIVLAGSGLRVGELLGLRLSDVDFLRRTIRVERQRLQSNQIAPLKSKASRRTVPVGQVVIDALAAHLASYPTTGDALFTDDLREPLTYQRWKRLLSDAAKAADVDVTSHSFRHFAASALISGSASVKQVQTFLGHASAMVTLRTYAHLWPGDEDRTRSVLDAALGPLGALADSLRTEATSEQ
ncbi:putative prophage phiRv2 integrase [Nocardioides psychrotolerans]|uniref:Site-specific recombinase XerD n=1 Tax=Nocardioides psychrotolerans TaxID=1005945 RepID=A0A1I3EY31_9ACTN|nr:site-specific integrase [Nocardioides psychrotolerans]GEP37951.1 putative prophage phiRv2 integrase [Nocardioides psychrotolerans]SFI03869.1 Site-specific recombinase XerD [Nocardioides psychrotolerans]